MNTSRISVFSRITCVLAAIALAVSIFVPLWRIELDAPQYPEGLMLQIFPHKIGGNVDIINGLNHYIGMKTLHTEDFVEFTILPYIIAGFSLLFLVTGLAGRRKLLYFSAILFILFGIISMIDFYRWNYNYGHNLDPNAAIVVPGMAYQPPIFGFKQLLNFGAYSIPDTGGWLFLGSGFLALVNLVLEWRRSRKTRRLATATVALFAGSMLFSSCSAPKQAEPVKLNEDECDFCMMTISDAHFAAELITEKGRVYKFDDLTCMQGYIKQSGAATGSLWVHDFSSPGTFIDATSAHYVQHDAIKSPMMGNMAAFADKNKAEALAAQYKVSIRAWPDLQQK